MVESEAAAKPSEPESEKPNAVEKEKLQQHHVSSILDNVLDEAKTVEAETQGGKRSFKHPLIIDFVLGLGLLFAMAGFTSGLMRMYVSHSAENCITEGNYKAAIALLEGSKLPDFFVAPSTEPRELLNRAYWMDAMRRLNDYDSDPVALKELERIMPDSEFFEMSQQILTEHTTPSTLTLSGGASQDVQVSEKDLNKPPPPPPIENEQ
jgi:hypothetical protein